MNVLFLSLVDIKNFDEENIYVDLLRELKLKNNNVFIVSPIERRNKEKSNVREFDNSKILRVKVGNIQKTNFIEKGISTLLIEKQFICAIKKYFNGVKFDLILYATPPITFCNVISFLKKRDNAKTYLMLKDIFPQNAVDLNVFSNQSIIYKYFRHKEKKLYKISDRIGCMSKKNVEYLIKNNEYLSKDKIEIFPNSITPKVDNKRNLELNIKFRKKFNIPLDSKVFMYGGNLGKPQGVDFIIDCLKKCSEINDCFFVICGSGTEYKRLEKFKNDFFINNLLLLNGLPKKEYMDFLNVADVGLIFLDYNFSIPNFPSRILSYMEKGIPVLSCTDPNTDIGDVIVNNHFGWKCYSNDSTNVKEKIEMILKDSNEALLKKGLNGLNYLRNNYCCEKLIYKFENLFKN